jgi:hypothetical protein
MKIFPIFALLTIALFPAPSQADETSTVSSEGVSLTIYNGNYAVVRDQIKLDLTKGINHITYDGATTTLEPDSVVLSGDGDRNVEILEQSYRQDVATPSALLKVFEGREIDFLYTAVDGGQKIFKGKIIRAGQGEPLIESEGKLRFGMPGTPLFPSLGEDGILKPALEWKIQSDEDVQTTASVSYLTGGLSWFASYNLVSPEKGDVSSLVGWITMGNQSGRNYKDAHVKLLAGEVNKVTHGMPMAADSILMEESVRGGSGSVEQKAFDEFHLYTLARPVVLRDRENKQVEFLRAEGVVAQTIYRLAGERLYYGGDQGIYTDPDVTLRSGNKIKVLRKIENTAKNGLGIPLPMGKIRLYRENEFRGKSDLEFVGENLISHTPKDEFVEIETGEAFDLVAERTRTDFRVMGLGANSGRIQEAFSIKLKNRKDQDVVINVVEYLRGPNWEITSESLPSRKTSASEVQWDVPVPAGKEVSLSYEVVYSW